jgi:sporulation protein YlmC with PRC-barrel domain
MSSIRTRDEVRDARLALLDRQIVDPQGELLGKVDDVELDERDGHLVLGDILLGPGALGPRLDRPFGRWMVAIWSRLSSRHDPGRIPMADVVAITSAVSVDPVLPESGTQGLEHWMRRQVITRLPGALDEQ